MIGFLSIITPVLNGERFIRTNIENVMKLATPHEHIIVDGGSIDNTLNILKEYPHLKVIHQNDQSGMYGGIKLGFDEAKGDIISWINCDDYPLPLEYDSMVKKMQDEKADFIYSDSFFLYEKTHEMKIFKSSLIPKFFLRHGIMPFIQPSTIYKKSFYAKIGLDSNYKIVGDMVMFFKMSKDDTAKFVRFRKPTVVFLKYGESLGDKNTERSFREREVAGIPSPNFLSRLTFYFFRRLF